ARAHGVAAVVAVLRPARAHAELRTGPGLGPLPSAVRPGRGRWLERPAAIYLRAGVRDVPALALRRLAAHRPQVKKKRPRHNLGRNRRRTAEPSASDRRRSE